MAPRLIPFDHLHRNLRRPNTELAGPVGDQGFRADQQHLPCLAAMQQQPNGRDGLHRFSQAHLVGQDGVLSRVEKSHALELKRERLEGKPQRLGAEQQLERRLQDVEESVFELDQIAGRRDPGMRGRPRPLVVRCAFCGRKAVARIALARRAVARAAGFGAALAISSSRGGLGCWQ